MQLTKHPDTTYWFVALLLGSMINLSLFLFIPTLSRTEPPAQIKIIELDFIAWKKPVPKKITQQKKVPPISKPKTHPKPIKKKIAPKKTVPQPVRKKNVITKKPEIKTIQPDKPITPPETPIKQNIPVTVTEPAKASAKDDALPTPVPIFKLTQLPRMIHRQIPVYPPAMKQQGKEATIKLEVLLDIKGKIRKITIKKSAGLLFDQAAIDAIRQSSFMPANVNGKAVAVLMKIPVKFRLR